MCAKSCLATIKEKHHSLTTAERKIADYILANSEAVLHMPIAELAQKSQSASSAVVRCCKALGFRGYSDLKISLAMELSKNKKLNYIPYISPDDRVGEILDKVFSANVKTLCDTAEKINRENLQKAVNYITCANRIYIYGMGTSSIFVNDFQYRLTQLGYAAWGITDLPSMKVSAANIKSGDIAIGISHSGRTIPTVDTLHLAKAHGANTICITSYPKSNITRECDCPIEVFSDEIQYPIEAISSRIAHISVIDAITIALSAQDYEKAFERSKSEYEVLNTIRYQK